MRLRHLEWYRSGYNGPDSKSGVPATVPWVRIPPTPPNTGSPRQGGLPVFYVGGMRSLSPQGKSHPLRQIPAVPVRGAAGVFSDGRKRKIPLPYTGAHKTVWHMFRKICWLNTSRTPEESADSSDVLLLHIGITASCTHTSGIHLFRSEQCRTGGSDPSCPPACTPGTQHSRRW